MRDRRMSSPFLSSAASWLSLSQALFPCEAWVRMISDPKGTGGMASDVGNCLQP